MHRRTYSPTWDALEHRALMSHGSSGPPPILYLGTPDAKVAVIRGTPARDLILVSASGRNVFAFVDGRTTQLDPGTRFLYISAGAGNDVVWNKTSLITVIHAGAGNDIVINRPDDPSGLSDNADHIFGDGGADRFDVEPRVTFVAPPDWPPFLPDVLGTAVFIHGTSGPDAVIITQTTDNLGPLVDMTVNDTVTFFHVADFPATPTIVLDLQGGDDAVTVDVTDVPVRAI